jgi:hypothetical protein
MRLTARSSFWSFLFLILIHLPHWLESFVIRFIPPQKQQQQQQQQQQLHWVHTSSGTNPLLPLKGLAMTSSSALLSSFCSSSSSSSKDANMNKNTTTLRVKLYPWREARRIARGHGFQTKQEFIDYECAGAYQLPKNPQEVWKEDWTNWDDWLGIVWDFETGREIARRGLVNVQTKEDYMKLFHDKLLDDDDPACRLPYRPDLKYKAEWQGWEDWLGC